MKRLVLAVAVLGLMACKKPEAAPAADTTAAPAAAPAMDSTMMGDTAHLADTSKMMGETKKAN
ncbi:MAG: hypothetical protein Q8Q85_08400 [Gemmatimonadales bacterium]|nr:hypothetical protein [Gemmatimonadales bacterium]